MAKQLQLRRGTTSQHSSFTGLVGEVTVDTDKDTAVVHDGSTAGGKPLATEALAAPKAGPTFTGTVAGVTKTHVGLANVDNESKATMLTSAALTGTPTTPTASAATNTTQIASTAYVRTEVANLADSAPAALDTLNELAAALGDDASFSSTVTTSIAAKLPLAGGAMTGAITTNSTFDGIDIATRDGVLTSTTTTAGAALPKAGGAMTGAITTNSTFDGVDIATRDGILTSTTSTAGAALPKAGGTMTGTLTVGVDGTGHDVKFYGDTSPRNMTWDQSEDSLHLMDNTTIRIGTNGVAGDMNLSHDGTNSYITNLTGTLKIATESSGVPVTIGHTTSEVTVADNLQVAGIIKSTEGQLYTKGSATHFEAQGDIIKLGTGSTTAGELCYYKADGTWAATDADAVATAGGVLLAMAIGTDPDVDGMLLRGMFTLDHDPGTIAGPLYVSTTAGDVTGTAPSATADVVRVVGYCLDSTDGQIWFNPSEDWIVLS